MSSLDNFLKAEDLDDLLKIRQMMGPLSSADTERILQVLREWQDGQPISNLLFHPSLVPQDERLDAVDRALQCLDRPYFCLAAVVGLQSVEPETVPEHHRRRWVSSLLEFVRADAGVLSSRASVTIWKWLKDDEWRAFVRAYPVLDETASDNILSFAVSRFGHLPRPEYRSLLRSCGLGFRRRRPFLKRYDGAGAPGSAGPLLSYIPNYKSVRR